MRYSTKIIAVFVLLLLFCFLSCKPEVEKPDDNTIAIVNGNNLTKNEVYRLIPDNITTEDSLEISEKYINKWIKDQLLFSYSKKNLRDTTGINKKLRDYKKTLYLYEFEKQYLEDNLDSLVSDEEVLSYYEKHMGNYVLEKPAVKSYYMIIKLENFNYYRTYAALQRSNPDNMQDIYTIDKRTGKELVEYKNWIYLDDLFDKINAVYGSDTEAKLRRGHFISEDSTHRYLVRIIDYKLPGDTIPPILIKDEITSIILNKRKNDLIINLKNRLLRDAKQSGEVVINEN